MATVLKTFPINETFLLKHREIEQVLFEVLFYPKRIWPRAETNGPTSLF